MSGCHGHENGRSSYLPPQDVHGDINTRQHQRYGDIAHKRQQAFQYPFRLDRIELQLPLPVDLCVEVLLVSVGLDILNDTQHLFSCVDPVILFLKRSHVVVDDSVSDGETDDCGDGHDPQRNQEE
jgi:hypothetical protein